MVFGQIYGYLSEYDRNGFVDSFYLFAEKRLTVILLHRIRRKKAIMHEEARVNKTEKPRMSRATGQKRVRSESRLRSQMVELGIDGDELTEKRQARAASTAARSQSHVAKRQRVSESMAAQARARSVSRPARDRSGLRDDKVCLE